MSDNPSADQKLCCPQCGLETEIFVEGYCQECCQDNQNRLDLHNATHDRWQGMTDAERRSEIRRAM